MNQYSIGKCRILQIEPFLEMLNVDWNSWQKFELTQNAMDYLVLLFSLYL